MSDVSGSWHPDPFGRFAQRYHDGTQWTEHVVDSSGAQSTDAPVASAAPTAAAPPTASYGAPPTASYGQPAYGAPVATSGGGTSLAIGPGLIAAGVGVLLLIVGVFALEWVSVDPEGLSRSDLADFPNLDDAVGSVSSMYISWGCYLGILAAAFAGVAAFNKDLSTKLKVPALIAVGVFAVWHAQSMFNINDNLSGEESGLDASMGLGLYVAALGYIAALVGAFLGPKAE